MADIRSINGIPLNDTTARQSIETLQNNLENIQLTPGPQGEKGEKGEKGDKGDTPSLTGYATETYVNNKIADLEAIIIAALQAKINELENGNVSVSCTSISLNKTSLTFTALNSSQTLTATVLPSNTTDTITWSTNNSSVATVYDGTVTSKGNGSCTITATCGSYSATCSITVSVEESTNVTCSSISLDRSSISFTELNATATLVATVTPSNCTDTVSWHSNNTSVATVSNGVVTSKGDGDCIIYVYCGSYSASCQVTVDTEENTSTSCTSITLSPTSYTFTKVGEQVSLIPTVTPTDTTDTITWQSSSSTIAKVNTNGVVTALTAGSCTITATCGSKTATCNVTVNLDSSSGGESGGDTGDTGDGTEVPCTKISLYPTRYTFEEISGWQVPTVTLTPSNTTDITKWSSSDTSVATVTTAGVIQPIGNGSCTITATCGSVSATISVTVNDVNVGVTLENFDLDQPLTITSKDDYKVEIIPEPASLRGYGSARWYTSAPNILGMRHYEGTGLYTNIPTTQTLYPGQNGTAIITVEYDLGTKGSMSKDFEITVAIPDDTENTAILYSNPTITIEGIKAKATQNGKTQYFDVSGEPNTGHVSYNSHIELTDSSGEKYYLALTNKGTSPFGRNGLHLNSGGWYSNGSDICTKYEMHHSALYYNDFNMNLKVQNIDNSIPTDLLNKALNLFNQTIPNLNMVVDNSSKNTIEMLSVDENWLGVCSTFDSDKKFVIQINQFRLNRKYGEYGLTNTNIKQWLSTVVHEFGHTLGVKDNAAHYPALMTYNRDSEEIYFLQPNDIAWIEHIHESFYGINLMTTQEEYEAQVANLDIDAIPQIVMDTQYNFDYAKFDEDDADLIVDCQLEYVETKEINISRTDREVLYEYRIYNIVDENIIKGEITNRQVKIHVSQLTDLDTSKRYRLYLDTYENTPSSLVNPEQGIIKL